MSNPNQANVDPEGLRNFANELSNLATRIQGLDKDMEQGLVRLGETFRDEEYQKFREHFMASRQKLGGFVDEIRKLVPKLNQDAEDIATSQRVKLDV